MTTIRSRDSAALLCLLLLVAAYLVAGYATLTPGHFWGDDWAQYTAHALNLARGHPYADTGYIFNPSQPHVGPPAYSPGLPLLLAPLVAVTGLNIVALKLTSLVALSLAVALTYLLYRDSLGAWVALAAAALFGLHDQIWVLRDRIGTEPIYLVWTLAALCLAARPLRGSGIFTGMMCGLLGYAAFATRPIGAALVLALALHEILQHRLLTWRFAGIVGVPAACLLLQKHFLAVADYSNELRPLTPQVLAGDAVQYWLRAGDVFPIGGPLTLLAPLIVLSLTALGVYYRIRPQAGSERTGTVSVLAALQSTPADVWYLIIYCAVLVVLPFVQETRYLLPTLPLVCAYSAYGISQTLKQQRYAGAARAAVFLAVLGYYASLHVKHDRVTEGDALCSDCRAMYQYLQDHTGADATVAFVKPRALALLTGRHAWMWSTQLDEAANWQAMSRTHVDYIVVVTPDSPFAASYPPYLSWDGWRSNRRLTLVYENRDFRVLHVQPASS
jgi:hypothetical protein